MLFLSCREPLTESTDYASTPPTSPTRVQVAVRRSLDASSTSPSKSIETLFSNFRIPSTTPSPPSGASKSYKTPPGAAIAPVTPSRTRPMFLSSLSSKRGANSSPGLLDLSSVPRFPSHPSTSSFSSSTTTPQDGLTPNGSTPKAIPDRPGLLSRWSTDSEGSGDGNEEGEDSTCTSPDCEVCEHDKQSAEDSKEDADFIRSPLPAGSPSAPGSLLPPAPKPHQQGFSPFVEAAPSSSALAPSSSSNYFGQQPRHVSSPASLPASRTCKKKLRNRNEYSSSSSSGSSDCFLRTPADSPSAESPMSSPALAVPIGPCKPLTRSQGLRIKDEGSRAKSRWGNRSLSAQITAVTNSTAASGSSTIKTASALLDGTISPAATTTDPLRVKLRQIPGAVTPDSGMPASPSPQTGNGIHHNQSHQYQHPYNRSLLTPELPRSPLHISSLPNHSSGNRSPNSSSNSKDIFSKSFSFAAANANRESPLGSPKFPLPSPRTTLPSVKENTNPYFAGYA